MGITIVFVRRGQTGANAHGIVQGQGGPDLNEVGRAQAERIAERFARESFGALYSSDLPRALTTAEAIAGRLGLEVRPTAAMRERAFGELSGLHWEQVRDRYPEHWNAWLRDVTHFSPPGGESTVELAARAGAFVDELARRHEGERVLVVAHGGPIRAAICQAVGIPLAFKRSLVVENGSISAIRRGRVWRLTRLNETWHLEAAATQSVPPWLTR